MTALEEWTVAAPFSALVSPELYPLLAYISLSGGLLATGMYVVQGNKTSLREQLQMTLLAALLLGFGTIFTSISVGIYV
ncbi:hypothetical protein BDF14DRAFT_1886874 [Spinellus fusiger]|nr:hypothetical protein BDF14DRAFT_1886874 [Spinellus fusiger]